MKLSLDHILAKDFFKVLETDDLSIIKDLDENTWQNLINEYEDLSGNRLHDKEISLSARIEGLFCKYKAINLACDVLEFRYDEETIDILKEHYFFINKENYQSELQRIKKESESILIQVKKLETQLPKREEKTVKKSKHIDEIIIGYGAFVGYQVKPNSCTVTEFISLKNLFESKLKQLEKPVKNGR